MKRLTGTQLAYRYRYTVSMPLIPEAELTFWGVEEIPFCEEAKVEFRASDPQNIGQVNLTEVELGSLIQWLQQAHGILKEMEVLSQAGKENKDAAI